MLTMAPMLQDAPFSLLAGGLHRCDPSWNKPADGIDQCYKLYLPVRGQARLTLDAQEVPLRPGHAYLIPGYHLVRQECPRRMDVLWVHFVPESLYLTFLLSHVASVHSWRHGSVEYWQATWKEIPSLFQSGSWWLFYRIQAMLMDLVARVLRTCGADHVATVDPVFEQLRPAIMFMDQHLLRNPRLAEIARVVRSGAQLLPSEVYRHVSRHAVRLHARTAAELGTATPLEHRPDAGSDCRPQRLLQCLSFLKTVQEALRAQSEGVAPAGAAVRGDTGHECLAQVQLPIHCTMPLGPCTPTPKVDHGNACS